MCVCHKAERLFLVFAQGGQQKNFVKGSIWKLLPRAGALCSQTMPEQKRSEQTQRERERERGGERELPPAAMRMIISFHFLSGIGHYESNPTLDKRFAVT